MDRPDGGRLGQREQVVVAAQVARMVTEALTPVASLVECARLQHRAHRAVEHEDALGQQAAGPDAWRG